MSLLDFMAHHRNQGQRLGPLGGDQNRSKMLAGPCVTTHPAFKKSKGKPHFADFYIQDYTRGF